MIKKIWWLLLVSSPVLAVPPTISPSTPVVNVGGTIQFTSGDSVVWSLSPGSTGTINSATGLYTAPPTFSAKNIIAGCPALPNDHIFNTRVDNLPLDTNSATRVSNMITSRIGFEVSFPLNVLTNATPTTTMTFFYSTQLNGTSFPLLSFPYAGIENAATPNDYFAQDRHQLGVNTDTCQFIEIYNKYPVGTNGSCGSCNAQSGDKFYGMSYLLPDGGVGGGATDAGGMYIEPLAIRYSELKAGSIKHALRFTLDSANIFSGFVWPATANATPGCTPLANCVPYGARFRLKSSFQIGHFSTTMQTILRALQQYGMFMIDGGTAMRIQTFSDVTADTATWNALQNEVVVSTIGQENFEQVDESTLAESTFSGHVNLTNAYVVPDNFSSVIATRISDNVTSTQTIAIQPVTIGTKNIPFPANSTGLSVMAGTPQFSIPFWVNGATTTTTTCTMSPTIGTLTSGCLYTAPIIQVNSLSTTTVTIKPTADPNQILTFPLVIFPSDAIRVRLGPKTAANAPSPTYNSAGDLQDSLGKWWWDDPIGNRLPWYSSDDNYYPQVSWPSITDVALFYTANHGNSDGAYGLMVPNGTYTLTLGFGTSDSGGVAHSSASIDSQGLILLSTTSVVNITYTPKTLSYTVNVTNNQFYFAVREVASDQFTALSKWSLIPILISGSETLLGNVKVRGSSKFR